MTFSERLNYLIDNHFDGTNMKFADSVGLSRSAITRWLDRKEAPRMDDKLLKTLKKRNINPDWLRTGNGTMLLDGSSAILSSNEKEGVPYYSMDVTASFVNSFDDILEKPEFYVNFRPLNDCNAYFPVYGESMFPKYCSGDIIAVKRFNTEYMLWGEPYLIITSPEANSLRTIKYVHQHPDNDKIILRAENPKYSGDTVIEKKHILGIFIIKGKVQLGQM